MQKSIEMRKRIVGSLLAIILSTLVLSPASPALAANLTKALNATYMGIKLYIDGDVVTPKDSAGKVVEPFVVDGTTYLPVRAVAEALGKEVRWDSDTNSVIIGEEPVQLSHFFNNAPNYSSSALSISPKHVYYKDGKLYMVAFVYNDLNTAVYNIRNVEIRLSNDTSQIADGAFGELKNVAIAPHTYFEWTFTFSQNALITKDADLSRIICNAHLEYSH